MDLGRLALIAAATLVSEDLTCLGSGLLVRRGELSLLLALAGCAAGIWLGDMGLWLVGRFFGRRALRWRWLASRLPAERLQRLGGWFDRNAPAAVIASRFLPGTRLPLYVAAGMLGRKRLQFAAWSLVAVSIWTPILVCLAVVLGESFTRPFERIVGGGWISVVSGALALAGIVRLGTLAGGPAIRVLSSDAGSRRPRLARPLARVRARVARLVRWEFWPAWLFYLPIVPWIAWLSLRHRGFGTITAANPGIPDGGFVGESKFDILAKLPAGWTLAAARIEPGAADERTSRLQEVMEEGGWRYPLVLKPDAGQRGAGVRLVRGPAGAARALAEQPVALLAQVYHPGPFEAGIFYFRRPSEPRGRILSITEKVFPEVVGDGVSTLEDLVLGDPRLRLQESLFLARHAGKRHDVLPAGERLRLAVAGNHCQGTMFRDGARLLTPALERRVDEIARSVEGFHFGRFDVRYADEAAFRAGKDLAIVELNGITSESTNLYDPAGSLRRAYGILARQWRLLFEIGSECRRLGAPVTPIRRLIPATIRYYRHRGPQLAAD